MRYLLALLLLATPAFAQEMTPRERAMGEKLSVEINASIAATTKVIELQQQLDAAQKQIKDLEAKCGGSDAKHK